MLAKVFLVGVFSSIYVFASVLAKQRLWLSLIVSLGIGMLLFMMIPLITPLNSTVINVVACGIGAILFNIGMGFASKAILSKTSLV